MLSTSQILSHPARILNLDGKYIPEKVLQLLFAMAGNLVSLTDYTNTLVPYLTRENTANTFASIQPNFPSSVSHHACPALRGPGPKRLS